jgi:rhodanese-related sulfurtransferase
MAMSFKQMAQQAMAEVDGISADDAHKLLQDDANALLIDVRDAADIPESGVPAGGANISLGMLPVRADLEVPEEWRDPRLQDRSRPIITTCPAGMNGARGAKLLKDMGFTNVRYMEGGMGAWNKAELLTD